MLAIDLISPHVFPLKKSDSVADALLFMRDWKVFDLPVVNNGEVEGYCGITQLQEASKSAKVAAHLVNEPGGVLQAGMHLFEVVRFFADTQRSTMAVMREGTFAGVITQSDLIAAYRHSALSQPGAILELQMPPRNYSLAEIARLVESNDAKILHLMITPVQDDSGHIRVTLKLNITEVRKVISTLERYQYLVTGVFLASPEDETFKSRYDNLLNYLNS